MSEEMSLELEKETIDVIMKEKKDFFKTCFDTVAGLNVENESQAIAKEVILDEIENLQQENQKLKGAIETYDILLKSNVKSTKVIEELEKYLEKKKKDSETGRTYINGMCFIGQNEAIYGDTLDKLKQLKEEE